MLMKKITFMLLAAFMAVVSWAGVPSDKMVKRAPVQMAGLSMDQAKQVTPKQKVATAKLQAPAKSLAAKAIGKAKAMRAPKKAGITDLLSADWMLCSDYYEYDSEAGQLVEATPASGATPITFSLVDAQTVAIEGFINGATEAIQATFTTTVSEELQAQGVVATATIADGQTLLENDYGPIVLQNVSAEEGTPMTVYILQTGTVVIDAIWAAVIGGDGQYAGYTWTNYCQSVAVPVNGKMTWGSGDSAEEVPVVIMQDETNPKVATVFNFAGEETAINVTMKEDKSFVISEQPMFYYDSTYGYVYLSGVSGSSLATIQGTGTDTELIFDINWVFYVTDGTKLYTYGDINDPATITLTQGEFVYPVIEDVAATPADPEVVGVGNYDASEEYGYFAFTIPTTDVDGNDLKEANLFYQLYADIAGEIQPITFTTDLYIKLTEDMSIIPYTFTDNYDFADRGDYKVVYLNFNFNTMYDRIGVKSIYTGGGETNESEIVWADVEKEEPAGPTETTVTFNFNKMDVPVSATGVTDGDITEDKTFEEGVVSLTIAPQYDGFATPNRFWSTTDGPQLRIYSNTMTFAVPDGYTITQIVFNHNGKWGANTVDGVVIPNDTEAKAATWTGDAQNVVVTVGSLNTETGKWTSGNSQINSIIVSVEELSGNLVVLPNGVEAEEYTMSYEDKDGNTSAKTVNVAVDGNDVYFQGFSEYIPEAWVKGTKDGNTVTFPPMQLFGEYSGYESYAFYGTDDVVFTYDAEADTYTAQGEIYGVLGDQYYDGHYYNPVIKKVADKAAMPANPEITDMENGSYGWYIDFNVPAVDVNGEDLAIGKLSYMIYTDTQGTIAPLTFTTATHSKLTEDMTEIPYGFTENYDFYSDEIYLNDLYSADWTRIGIQSIYRGGGEENKTEIQWFDILPEPEAIEAPEGLVTEAYLFSAIDIYANANAARRVENEEPVETYTYQMQVGFDGNDVYFKGVSDDTADMWLKGTLSKDGKTVTIPANQYMGQIDIYGIMTFDYFFAALGEDNKTLEDIVLNYNAETSTFTTDQTLVLHDGKRSLGEPYQVFTDVVISKMVEFAATPADPSIDSYKLEGTSYPYISLVIPAKDVDGNDIISSKLFYTVWIELDGIEQPFVVRADEYRDVTEDMTEIPYDWDDSYDIYKGGSRFYINPINVIPSWTKIGVQSIYYGGGECNKSNIVWMENPIYDETIVGIRNVNAEAAKVNVIFDLQGRRVAKVGKGLYIVNGKKVVK